MDASPLPHVSPSFSGLTTYNPWVFPKIGVPQNGWFIRENPIKIDDLGVALFSKTPNMLMALKWHPKASRKMPGVPAAIEVPENPSSAVGGAPEPINFGSTGRKPGGAPGRWNFSVGIFVGVGFVGERLWPKNMNLNGYKVIWLLVNSRCVPKTPWGNSMCAFFLLRNKHVFGIAEKFNHQKVAVISKICLGNAWAKRVLLGSAWWRRSRLRNELY